MSERYDGKGQDSPDWWPSRYGPADERGAANELTSEVVMDALGLPRNGVVIDLSQTLDAGSPLGPAPRSFHMVALAHGALPHSEFASKENELIYVEELAAHPYHVGTHLDGLGHVGIAGRMYNGHRLEELFAVDGLERLGAEQIPPFVTRGVLLDIAGLVGVDVLSDSFEITADLLQAAADGQGIEPRPGDAILLNTGWAELWLRDPERYAASEPGAVVDAAHWLIDRRPSVVGADNWAFEVVPPVDPERPFIVHQHLITEAGIYILENIVTRELCEREISEFLFLMNPIAVRGATGAMVRPAAVI